MIGSRHSFCTKLAENGVPEATMLDMMGHVSAAMLRCDSHALVRARRGGDNRGWKPRFFHGPARDTGMNDEERSMRSVTR